MVATGRKDDCEQDQQVTTTVELHPFVPKINYSLGLVDVHTYACL